MEISCIFKPLSPLNIVAEVINSSTLFTRVSSRHVDGSEFSFEFDHAFSGVKTDDFSTLIESRSEFAVDSIVSGKDCLLSFLGEEDDLKLSLMAALATRVSSDLFNVCNTAIHSDAGQMLSIGISVSLFSVPSSVEHVHDLLAYLSGQSTLNSSTISQNPDRKIDASKLLRVTIHSANDIQEILDSILDLQSRIPISTNHIGIMLSLQQRQRKPDGGFYIINSSCTIMGISRANQAIDLKSMKPHLWVDALATTMSNIELGHDPTTLLSWDKSLLTQIFKSGLLGSSNAQAFLIVPSTEENNVIPSLRFGSRLRNLALKCAKTFLSYTSSISQQETKVNNQVFHEITTVPANTSSSGLQRPQPKVDSTADEMQELTSLLNEAHSRIISLTEEKEKMLQLMNQYKHQLVPQHNELSLVKKYQSALHRAKLEADTYRDVVEGALKRASNEASALAEQRDAALKREAATAARAAKERQIGLMARKRAGELESLCANLRTALSSTKPRGEDAIITLKSMHAKLTSAKLSEASAEASLSFFKDEVGKELSALQLKLESAEAMVLRERARADTAESEIAKLQVRLQKLVLDSVYAEADHEIKLPKQTARSSLDDSLLELTMALKEEMET
jgi:hypothetical protein